MTIRREAPGDEGPIATVTEEAFRGQTYSSGTEQFIAPALRNAGALTISLVAVIEDRIAGHVAFSPVTIDDGSHGWYGLGPLAVEPGYQKKGIGRALVLHGLDALKEIGANGCVVVGDPHYYARFGFERRVELSVDGVPPQHFQCLSFCGSIPAGCLRFHGAFEAKE